jgi:hypothetical protein
MRFLFHEPITKAPSDAGAFEVGLVVVDLDLVDLGESKRRYGQQPRRMDGMALPQMADAYPVADLHALAPGVDVSGAADDDAVLKDSHGDGTTVFPDVPPFVDERTSLTDGHRFLSDPIHPRPKMFDAFDHGLVKHFRIISAPEPYHETVLPDRSR